jgi:hypothetical protein
MSQHPISTGHLLRVMTARSSLSGLAVLTTASMLTCCTAPPQTGAGAAADAAAPAAATKAAPDDAQVQRQAQEHADRVAAAMQHRGPAAMAVESEPAAVPVVRWLDDRSGSSAANVASVPGGSRADAAAAAPMIIDAPAPVVVAPAPSAPAEPAPAAMAPAPALSREQLATQLLAVIRASDEPPLTRALAAAALSIVQHQTTLDAADLASLEQPQKQAVKQYHALLTELAQRIAEGKNLDSESLLSDLQSGLAQGPLAIRQVALCRNVRSYGVYEPFDSQTFLAGREQPMIVYVELDHFLAQKMDDGQLEVRLQQEIELYNEADGLAVWKQPAVEIVDKSRNRRRDFFVVQMVRLPARLTVGKYLLKVRVHDKHGGSIDETTLPIQMVADTSLVKQ